ncbi:MAG: hypothetical protein ACM3IJ_02230 [Candidatus Levyibacteriota bacterium]
MKYIIVVLVLALLELSVSTVFAQGVHAPGTGIVNPTTKGQSQGTGNALQATPSLKITPTQDQDRLRTFLRDQEQVMDKDRDRLQEKDKIMQQDQDRTMLGAKVLIQAREDNNELDSQVENLATQVKNTIQNTLKLEQQIRDRNFLMRLFWGGDKKTGQELYQITTQNKDRIREMERLVESCNCNEETKNLLREQLRIMDQEQMRLNNMAQEEIRKKGLFSWF